MTHIYRLAPFADGPSHQPWELPAPVEQAPVHAFQAEIIHQQQELIAEERERTERANHALGARVAVLDAKIQRLRQDALPLKFLPPWLVWLLVAIGGVGEAIVAAIAFRSLGLNDFEAVLAGISVCVTATGLTKALAYGLRVMPAVHRELPDHRRIAWVVIGVGSLALVVLLFGMACARWALDSAEARIVDGHVLGQAGLWGLGLVNSAMVIAQFTLFYTVLSAKLHRDSSRQQNEAVDRVIHRLLAERGELCAQHETNVRQFCARRSALIAHGWRIVNSYSLGLARHGAAYLLTGFDARQDDAFYPPVPMFPLMVAPPPTIQQLAQGLHATGAANPIT